MSLSDQIKKVQELRLQLGRELNILDTEVVQLEDIVIAPTPETVSIKANTYSQPSSSKSILTINPTSHLSLSQVKSFKPVDWIDCIERDTPRVFLREHFIIARIVLPSVNDTKHGLLAALE